MTNPVVKVATDALRQEASVWATESDALHAVQAKAEGLRMTGLEAGMFIMILDAYTKVVDVVSGRCGEGAQEMGAISTALRQIADVYDTEEQANVHKMTGLY